MENNQIQEPKKTMSKLKIGLYVVGGIIAISFFFGGGQKAVVEEQMQDVKNQVAQDAIEQYEIAKRNGTKTDIYVNASMVSAAFLQAKDEPNYAKWKAIEKQAAKDAGMPNY